MRAVLTGSPCTGKTSILRHLARIGWMVFPESIRWKAWILKAPSKQEVISRDGLGLLPIQSFREDVDMEATEKVCFDRSVLDLVAYQMVYSRAKPDALLEAQAKQCAARLHVAFFSQLDTDVYATDSLRDESISRCCYLESMILETYTSYGVPLIRLPSVAEADRALCIEEHCCGVASDTRGEFPPVVSAVLSTAKGLLILRYTQSQEWTIPGGKVHKGESLEDAITREILEETGIRCEEYRYSIYRDVSPVAIHSGHLLFYFYVHIASRPKVILSSREHDAYRWISSSSDIPEHIHPALRTILETHCERRLREGHSGQDEDSNAT